MEKLHNEETNDMFYSTVTFTVIQSRRISWVVHIVVMGERRGVHKILVGNLREIDNLEDPSVDGPTILRLRFRKWDMGAWNGSN